MAYFPPTGSVVAFQSSGANLQVGASVVGLTPVNVTNANLNVGGSVVAFQGTSPWVVAPNNSSLIAFQLAGSILATSATFTPPANQSVSGTVNTLPLGTIVTSLVSTVPSSVIVGASIFGLPPVNVTNTNLNVGGSVVAFQGTGWSGSVAATVTNNPTFLQLAGSILATSATVNTGNSSVQVLNFPTTQNVSGSVMAFQGTNPWVIQSIVGTYAEDAGHTTADKGLFILGVRNDAIASFVSADLDYTPNALDSAGRTIIKPFAPEDGTIISYTGSVVSTSVTLIQASAVGKRSYITDFWVANTGSSNTLITFQDGSTSVIGYTIAPATGGSNSPGIAIPLKTAPSQDLAFKSTTASSIIYLTVKGYQAP